MSKREKQTAFLRALVVHAAPAPSPPLLERITRAEREEKCSRRAFRLVLILGSLAAFGQFYLSLLAPESLGKPSHFASRSLSALFAASLVSGAAFLACWFWHRALLDRAHEESRRFIITSMPPRMETGDPAPALAEEVGRTYLPEPVELERSGWELFASRRPS